LWMCEQILKNESRKAKEKIKSERRNWCSTPNQLGNTETI